MATTLPPPPSASESQALESLRQRLLAFTTSLRKLTADLSLGAPLLPPEELAASLSFTSYHLQQLSAQIAEHANFLSSAHVYPLPHFPGTTQEALLAQLLRKRLEPSVEELLNNAQGTGTASISGGFTEMQRIELWSSAAEMVRKEVEEVPQGWDYTIEEVVNGIGKVKTGLTRKLHAEETSYSDEESDEESDDAMEVDSGSQKAVTRQVNGIKKTAPPMNLEDIVRFMSRGDIPRPSGIAVVK